ncbi:vasculin-like protein 1 isoform X1 [Mytilus trossulus]|uniref:vasculin-like protein 1 isoform X1 n=1 Tax=Mytilus trossulus TaxID=6551 RepID=UPI00300468BA
MATNNAPKHDFAPAWLKIPSHEAPKQSGSKPFDSDKSNSRPRSHKDDSFFNKRHPLAGGKYRHHSVEDDYYSGYPPYGPYGYYNGYGMPYNSQPSIYRSPSREGKYPPNMRFNQINGAPYPPGYYDLYSFDYYHGDHSYYANYPNSRVNTKRGNYERDGRTNSKDKEDKSKGKDDDKDKPPFQDEFPSLNGEEKSETSTNGKLTNGSSVWEHPPHGKGTSSKLSDNRQTANIYKTLVPNKQSAINRKPGKEGLRLNGGLQKEPFSSVKTNSKEAPTSPIEILNTRFVTQPRNLGNKKSEFLRALRKENSGSDRQESSQSKDGWPIKNDHTDQLTNGVERLAMDDSSNMLSSSLEAEQRLLKEMGWNETDQEDYEITEADKKMFQDLYSTKQQNRNTRVNKTFSPKHIPVYQPNAQELNDTLSSSDSDSDGQ